MDGLENLRLGYPSEATHGLATRRTVQLNGNRSRRGKNKGGINMRAVAEVLHDYGLNPADEVIKLIVNDQIDDELKARLYMEMLEYCQPKLSRTEHTGKDGGELIVEIVKFADQAAQ